MKGIVLIDGQEVDVAFVAYLCLQAHDLAVALLRALGPTGQVTEVEPLRSLTALVLQRVYAAFILSRLTDSPDLELAALAKRLTEVESLFGVAFPAAST